MVKNLYIQILELFDTELLHYYWFAFRIYLKILVLVWCLCEWCPFDSSILGPWHYFWSHVDNLSRSSISTFHGHTFCWYIYSCRLPNSTPWLGRCQSSCSIWAWPSSTHSSRSRFFLTRPRKNFYDQKSMTSKTGSTRP